MPKFKSLSTTIKDILSSRIHEAFTVASDQLTQRGYLTQNERIPLSGLIGDLLDKFNSEIDPAVSEKMVSDLDVGEIAQKEQSGEKEMQPKLKAAMMKKEGDGEHPASHYLVAEDPKTVTTWHLRVMGMDGKPDHTLMGAAWAALHGGYRGNKYEGSGKAAAIAKLTKLYGKEKMAVPSTKELSLWQTQKLVEDAFAEEFGGAEESMPSMSMAPSDSYATPGSSPWIMDIFPAEDYLIACALGKNYKVGYKIDEFGDVTFDPLTDWQEVQKPIENNWVTKELHSSGSSFIVLKQRNGIHRWVGFSSNAFRDNEKEIISTKALEEAVARNDAAGDYGTLRWWHVGEPDIVTQSRGEGLDIGTCDFSAMHGAILVESGEIPDARVAAALKERAPELGMSIGFFHSASQPNEGGVYDQINIFERSILPAARAANGLAAITILEQKENSKMLATKLKAFAKILGSDEVAKEVIAKAEGIEAKAKQLGIEFKEADPSAPESVNDAPVTKAQMEEAIKKALEPLQATLAESKELQVAATKELSKGILDALTELAEKELTLEQGLKDLQSFQPRRASQSAANVLTEEQKKKLKEQGAVPQDDPKKNDFFAFVTGQELPAA